MIFQAYPISTPVSFDIPVLYWVRQRASYVENPNDPGWVLHDPVVNCLVPALYVLDKKEQYHLSEDIRDAARNKLLINKSRWMMMEYHLKHILDMLYRADIDVIPLKGVILQSLLYRDSGVRAMIDVDLLVRPERFFDSANLLVQSGFVQAKQGSRSLTDLEKLPVAYGPGELTFHNGKGFRIDLHRSLMPVHWFSGIYYVKIDDVWERSIRLSDDEQAIGAGLWKRILSPYDMLAHLCLHSSLHGLQVLKNYLDIDLLIRNLPPSWDWDRFIEITNQWQIRSTVFHVMIICKKFMATPVPDDVLEQIDPGWLARWRVSRLISPKTLLADRSSLGKRYPTLVKLSLADHVSKICLAILKLAFPDRSMYTRHHVHRGVAGHWLHVLDVIKRGD